MTYGDQMKEQGQEGSSERGGGQEEEEEEEEGDKEVLEVEEVLGSAKVVAALKRGERSVPTAPALSHGSRVRSRKNSVVIDKGLQEVGLSVLDAKGGSGAVTGGGRGKE